MLNSSIWFFGDSYSVSPTSQNVLERCWSYDDTWTGLISKKLNLQPFYRSMHGVANEWIFSQVMKEVPNFKSGDVIIVQTTSSNRKWFFKDRPDLGNFTNIITEDLKKEQIKAIEAYIMHLYHEEQDDAFYTAFLYSYILMSNAYKNNNLKMILLPGFHGCPGVVGDLTTDVCDKEFINIEARNRFYEKHKWDPRINHMSQENHHVLADKLYNNIVNDEAINLTTDFITNIYN